MKAHWSVAYRGAQWAEEANCFHWFRWISREQFGRDIPDAPPGTVDCNHLTLSAARLMAGNIMDLFGGVPTDTPREGDAVLMTKADRPHHIGMVVMPGNRFHVLHVLDGVGLVISNRLDLATNGWKITGFYTPHEDAA